MHLLKYNGKTFATLFTNTELYIFLKIIVLQRHLAMIIIDFIITSTKIEYLEMKDFKCTLLCFKQELLVLTYQYNYVFE